MAVAPSSPRCPGTLSRRAFVRTALAGLGSLSLADLLRLQAAGREANDRSVIVLWLWGGPSHMETFDLKPDAPAEYRGEFRPIGHQRAGPADLRAPAAPGPVWPTSSPCCARCTTTAPATSTARTRCLTGYPGEAVEAAAVPARSIPDLVRGGQQGAAAAAMPANARPPGHARTRYNGSAYLGSASSR